jgi:hypothetical protein
VGRWSATAEVLKLTHHTMVAGTTVAKARLLLAGLLVAAPGTLRGQKLPDGELGYVKVSAVCSGCERERLQAAGIVMKDGLRASGRGCAGLTWVRTPAQYNPFNPSISPQATYPANKPEMVGGGDGQDALKCYILNSAAHRMEPQGFGGSAPKEWTGFGFHSQPTLETQILMAPSAAHYRPLARLPKNDGCAYQANFAARTSSGCNITGVPAEPVAAGGFRFPDPFSNASHCQLFASCIPVDVWQSDPRHADDLGAQGQWCSELGGCWRPATGVKTHGCLCYSDRPLKDWYGPGVQAEELPVRVHGGRALACTQHWIRSVWIALPISRVSFPLLHHITSPPRTRIMGGTRCGFFGHGNLARQHPIGEVIRDRGEGKQENPTLVNSQKSRMYGEALEQDSDSFVFRRHPACYVRKVNHHRP